MPFTSKTLDPELRGHISRVWKLSVPAILTQISNIIMQYIDSAMVGKLGADASAAIGLVASSTWLMGGLCSAVAAGFSVQVAHYIGGRQPADARRVVKHGIVTALLAGLLLLFIGCGISGALPRWLGSEAVLWRDASAYFFVFACSLPFMALNNIAAGFLQCSGNMVVPSVLNSLMCLLDVIFNALLIPRLGVLGAGIGTALSLVLVSLIMLWFCCLRSEALRINRKEPCPLDISILRRALRIGVPVGAEQTALCAAMVATTAIIAPLGSVDIAANSFAITAEALCYMPGFGIAAAATTVVGQSLGAGDLRGARQLANICTAFGFISMALTGALMFVACPLVFRLLTPVAEVQLIAAQILRIGLLAEPFYGLSLVASGGLRGAEDTLVPSVINLLSIWVVRLGLALLLVGRLGIHGVWIAMAMELTVRGLALLARQLRSPYLRKS